MMATVDTSIYNSLLRPPKSVQDYDNEAMVAQQNALALNQGRQQLMLGQMKADEYRRGQQDQATIRNALLGLGAGATDEQRIAALKGTGLPGGFSQADALEKAGLERKKTAAEVSHKDAQAAKERSAVVDASLRRYRTALDFVDSPQAAARWMQAQYQDPEIGAYMAQTLGPLEQTLSRLPTDPAGFAQWRQQAALGMEKHIAAMQDQQRIAETGRHNRASEGIQIRGQDVSAATAAASRAQAERHHQDARTKPFEVSGPDGTPMLVQQSKDGTLVPVQGFGPKSGGDKPLPQAVLKSVTEARDNAATIDRLSGSFKDSFAGKGILGLGADTQIAVSGNLGVDRDAVEWWKNYRKQAELVERHALFGAALTPTEQGSWRSADVAPGMDAKVVRRNLETRAALAKKVLETTRQDLIDAGHSAKRVGAIADRGLTPASTGGLPSMSEIDAEIARRAKGK